MDSKAARISELERIEVSLTFIARMLYVEPTEEYLCNLIQENPFDEAPWGGEEKHVAKGLALLSSWASQCRSVQMDCNSLRELARDLRSEWLELFVGTGSPKSSLLESYYVEPDGRLFGRNVIDVRETFSRSGLQSEKLHAEPDDNLGLMLSFLAVLVHNEAESLESDDEALTEKLFKDQNDFLCTHILPWICVWESLVVRYARCDYYRGVGLLTFGMIAAYAKRFDIRLDEESSRFVRRAATTVQ